MINKSESASSEPATKGDVRAWGTLILIVSLFVFALVYVGISALRENINSRCVPAASKEK